MFLLDEINRHVKCKGIGPRLRGSDTEDGKNKTPKGARRSGMRMRNCFPLQPTQGPGSVLSSPARPQISFSLKPAINLNVNYTR